MALGSPEAQRIKAKLARQKEYYAQGNTRSVDLRVAVLKRLYEVVAAAESEIAAALAQDLNKSGFESYLTEVGMTLDELRAQIEGLRRWAAPRAVPTPLGQFAAASTVYKDPYGCVLVMAPWNYPFLLSFAPLAGAVAAGNCVLLKPSAYAPATGAVMKKLLARVFPAGWVTVVEGGRKENSALLEQPFDFIFFTGSPAVGRLVMKKAAAHLTPVALELGGKSPVIVDETADIPLAAKRIAFGKLLNAGQTCVAPDYILVQRSVRGRLIAELQWQFAQMLGDAPLENSDYVRIVNRKHFKRLRAMLAGCEIISGGGIRKEESGLGNAAGSGWIEPTLVADTLAAESPAMAEEIFGPILPVIPYDTLPEAIRFVNSRPHPLALYLFTESRAVRRAVLRQCAFGGGCVNDTVIHLATHRMPFGGVGASGMGHYHGRSSFDTFTHEKSIVDKATWLDLPMRYQPYTQQALSLVRHFLH